MGGWTLPSLPPLPCCVPVKPLFFLFGDYEKQALDECRRVKTCLGHFYFSFFILFLPLLCLPLFNVHASVFLFHPAIYNITSQSQVSIDIESLAVWIASSFFFLSFPASSCLFARVCLSHSPLALSPLLLRCFVGWRLCPSLILSCVLLVVFSFHFFSFLVLSCLVLAGVVWYLRSPSLMSASFSMRETLDGSNFTWTSAGPTADGDIGKTLLLHV